MKVKSNAAITIRLAVAFAISCLFLGILLEKTLGLALGWAGVSIIIWCIAEALILVEGNKYG